MRLWKYENMKENEKYEIPNDASERSWIEEGFSVQVAL